MAMSIKTSPELWGEDAKIFTEEAERTGVYYSTDDVLSMMQRKLDAAKAAKRK